MRATGGRRDDADNRSNGGVWPAPMRCHKNLFAVFRWVKWTRQILIISTSCSLFNVHVVTVRDLIIVNKWPHFFHSISLWPFTRASSSEWLGVCVTFSSVVTRRKLFAWCYALIKSKINEIHHTKTKPYILVDVKKFTIVKNCHIRAHIRTHNNVTQYRYISNSKWIECIDCVVK